VKYLRRSWLKVGAVLILALVLLAVVAVPSLADTPTTTATPKVKITPTATHSAQGKVASLAVNSIVLQDGTEAPINLTVDANTKYFMLSLGRAQGFFSSVFPRASDKNLPDFSNALRNFHLPSNWKDDFAWLERFGAQAQLSDVAVGDRIIARLAASSFLAQQVLIIKTPAPLILQGKGIVTAIGADSFTIQPTTGAAVSLKWDANTRFALKGLIALQVGQYATASYNRNTLVALTVDVQAPTPRVIPTRTTTVTH
jgi:hypothetical protein